VPSERTSLLTRHGAGTWVEGPAEPWCILVSLLTLLPHLQVFENTSLQRQYPRSVPNLMTNENGTEDPAVPPLDVGLKAACPVFAGWQFEIYGHGRWSPFSLTLPTDGMTRAV